MSTATHKRKRIESTSTAGAVARSHQTSSNDIIDLVSSDDNDDTQSKGADIKASRSVKPPPSPPPRNSAGYKTFSVSSPLNDNRLCGTHKLITLESAQYYIHLVAEFMQDEEDGKSGNSFTRDFFDPLWQRLKDQGNHSQDTKSSGGNSTSTSSVRNSCSWGYQPTRDPLSAKNWAFVPPRSSLGAKGKLGRDYYMTDEHVALSVLEDISTMEEVSDLFTVNAHYFTAIIPILDRAVTEHVEYKIAALRCRENTATGETNANTRKSMRSCNFQSFGVECALMEDPYGLSGDEMMPFSADDEAESTQKMGHASSSQQSMGAPSSDTTTFCDHEMMSNLSGVEPKLNMPIEIRDSDFIWNMSRIIRISYESNERKNSKCEPDGITSKCHVTIRYKGWGPDWDETLPYPNERLARVFTYTKQVKCFVALLGSKEKEVCSNENTESIKNIINWMDTWPCQVVFRMPHPNQPGAPSFLTEESKIYVEPYMAYLLPSSVQKQLNHGGQWISTDNMLHPWEDLNVHDTVTSRTDDCILHKMPSGGLQSENALNLSAYHVTSNFCQAYQMAQSDMMLGKLPPKVLFGGALLKDEYCVQNVGGDVINGVRYSGSFPTKEKRENSHDSLLALPFNNVTEPSFLMHMPNISASKVSFVPPPSMPQPIPITDMAYPDQGVRRLPDQGRWASILRIGGGNEVFLGSYASQTEAAYAVKLASPQPTTLLDCSAVTNTAIKEETAHDTFSPSILALTNYSSCEDTDNSLSHLENVMVTRERSEKDTQDTAKNTNGKRNITKTPHLPHFPNSREALPFASDAGKIADLLNTPIESIVSAFENAQTNSDEKQTSQPQFRVQDWLAQHYRYVQHLKGLAPMTAENVSNDYALTANVKNHWSMRKKRRKQHVPKRLHLGQN